MADLPERLELRQHRIFKSAQDLGTVSLRPFAVIAGINGAGKTHLLQAIKDGAVQILIDDRQVETDEIEFHDWNSFAMTDAGEVSLSQLRSRAESEWQQIKRGISGGQVTKVLNEVRTGVISNLADKQILSDPLDQFAVENGVQRAVDGARLKCRKALLAAFPQFEATIHTAESATQRTVFELKTEDYVGAALGNFEPGRLLQQRISSVFIAYNGLKDENDSRSALAARGENLKFLTDAEFIDRYGPPPWELMNGLFADMGLDFHATSPGRMEASYSLKLVQRTTEVEVALSDLSSGERVLIALALSLYGTSGARGRLKLPRVLLLDEVDAPLHPAMVRTYINTIQDVLVANGVVVLLTTHCPSTVALSPEGHVWEMNKRAPRLQAVSNQQALSKLTAGVSALSVRFQTARQVFVESKYDVRAYNLLMDAVRAMIASDQGVVFLPAAAAPQEGGCSLVRTRVKELRSADVDTAFGLIDYDLSNHPSEDGSIIVLGGGVRYCIENYVLDPLLIAALCVREKKTGLLPGLDDILGESFGTWRGLERADSETLQRVVDLALATIHKDPTDDRLVDSPLVSGETVRLPAWFCEAEGHSLFEKWQAGIPWLRTFATEEALKGSVLARVVADVPQLLSLEVFHTLARVAGSST